LKLKKIFISHASKDQKIIKAFIDDILHGALSVKISQIFCTTTDGTKIESGEDWRNSIRDALIDSRITFLIISPNYKESEVSICEMGAAWVCSGKVIPLMVDPVSYSSVGIIQQPKQIEKLLDETSLDRIRDIIQRELSINPEEIKSDRWTLKKKEFLQKVNLHIKENPFYLPLSREEFEKTIKEKEDLEGSLALLITEKSQAETLIEELKRAKDVEEIKAIEKKYSSTTSIEEFYELCEKVAEQLKKLSSIIRGAAYISFSGKDVRLGYQGWRDEIDDAISRDYIDEDQEADWVTSKVMRSLESSLNELDLFIKDHNEDEDFISAYDEEYDAPLSLSNIDFWEKAFNLSVVIS